jgi:hypothetical protein
MSKHLTPRQITAIASQLLNRCPEVVDAALNRIDVESRIAVKHMLAAAEQQQSIHASLATDQVQYHLDP